VTFNGQQVWKQTPERTIAVVAKTLGEYGDPTAVFSAEITVEAPTVR
jgi:hypothetical protein